jgi:hypothetical protein
LGAKTAKNSKNNKNANVIIKGKWKYRIEDWKWGNGKWNRKVLGGGTRVGSGGVPAVSVGLRGAP